ncbi:hypothetical protein [Flavobacterium marginilacus]|uniref:glycoside hydrolase family 130 protein n=1 Tax=Flavobacterium marginilacus TaxID=3003256 RepID=UPI00248DE902|nr:hypothetical protein [Flavobacterium marginilacus]
MDLEDPSRVIARTEDPIVSPTENYELAGFFGNVVFTNGHILNPDGDTVTIYYGASDEFVCGAEFSIKEIFPFCSMINSFILLLTSMLITESWFFMISVSMLPCGHI